MCRSFELQCKSVELHCNSIELHCNHLNVIASFLNLDATVVFHLLAFVYCLLFTFFSAEAVLGTTEAVSYQAACRSCVGNCCQGIQFCLQKPSNYLAEAVHRFCRCLTVATVLDSSCLVMSSSCDVHFTVFGFDVNCFHLVSSLMSLACSWTHVDSLDDVCNSFHSCHGFAVQLVDSFSLLCFWDVLVTWCT